MSWSLVGGGFDWEARRKPQVFAADAVAIDIYSVSIGFFLTGLNTSCEFAEFIAIRHGCFSIRLFTSCKSHLSGTPNLLDSHHRSSRGDCGFVLVAYPDRALRLPLVTTTMTLVANYFCVLNRLRYAL
jgi:hypothetical protein